MKTSILTALSLFFFVGVSTAQQESDYEITGSSKRGNLVNLNYDATGKKQFTLSYLTPTTINGKGVYETYIFDNNFKFVSQNKKEDDLTAFPSSGTSAKKYKGESYVVESVEPTYTMMTFDLVLQNKKNTYNYNWDINDYFVTSSISGEKVIKPSETEGAAYYYYCHSENEASGQALVLASVRDKMFGKGIDANKYLKKYRIMLVDKSLELAKVTSVDFESPKQPIYHQPIYSAADPHKLESYMLLFAPTKGVQPMFKKKKGTTEEEPVVDPNATKYCLVKTNAEGEIEAQVYFNCNASGWAVNDLIFEEKTKDLYVVGRSKPGPRISNNEGVATQQYDELTVVKLSNNELAYAKTYTVADIKDKTVTVTGKANKAIYSGRNFETMGTLFTKNGDLLLYGVNYNMVDSLGNKSIFDELVTFHFSKEGDIKSVYAIVPNKKNYKEAPIPNKMIVMENDVIYWILEENDGIKKNLTNTGSIATSGGSFSYNFSFAWKYKYLLYPRIVKIDVNSSTMTEDAEKIGKGEYYLDNRFPYVVNKNEVVFFGASASGKKIWFKRVTLK